MAVSDMTAHGCTERTDMRRLVATVVVVVVAASCIPWLRHQRFFSVSVAITAVVLAGLMVLGVVQALAKRSRKELEHGESTQPGSRSRRLRNLSVGAAVVFVLMLTVPHFIARSSGAYKLAIATAKRTPQFTETLGTPIKEAWFSEGSTKYENPAQATLMIPVTGSKQKGDLYVVAIREDGRWRLKELTLELMPSGKRIDLLSPKDKARS